MEQTTERKHPVGIQAFGRFRRGKQLLALIWAVLFLLFQAGMGIHVRNCGHCCSHEKAVCHTQQEFPGHHSHQQCHNCPSCFKLLKLSDFFPSEKWDHMPVQACNIFNNLLRICRTEVQIVGSDLPVEEKGDPPSRAGSNRYLHFCHRLLLYA